MIRAVLDTNVLVSSFVRPSGVPGQTRRAWQAHRFELALSEPLFRELAQVLARPVLRRLLKVEPSEIERFLRLVAEISVWPEHELDEVAVIDEDPEDNVVLATAVATSSELVVSGDRHLLEVEVYRGIAILTPRQLPDMLPDLESEPVG